MNHLHLQDFDLEWIANWVNSTHFMLEHGHPRYTRHQWLIDLKNGCSPFTYEEALKLELDKASEAISEEYFWHFDYRFEMRPLNPLIRDAIRITLSQHNIEEDAPENPAYSQIINQYTHDNYAPEFKEALFQEDSIVKITARAYADNKFYEVLNEAGVRSGPFDGACLVCAKALMTIFGGYLVRIVSNLNNGQTEHYGIKIGETIFDMGGSYKSPQEWIKRFSAEQYICDRTLSTDIGFDASSVIIDDVRATNILTKYLQQLACA